MEKILYIFIYYTVLNLDKLKLKEPKKIIFMIKTFFSSNLTYKNLNFTGKMGNYLG